MSSSSVCQGLQSCLEPRHIEPRVLRLKLAPPVLNLTRPSGWPSSSRASLSGSDPHEESLNNAASTNHERDMKSDKNAEVGGWSFLQSLSDPSSHCDKTKEPEAEKVYVHPTVKCSSSTLSAKSLEMCTESLGCETGSDCSDDISLFSLESSSCFTTHAIVGNKNSVSKRLNRGGSFPPPLTSITDLGGVQVRPHRKDGRLILEAVSSPSPQPYFQAERSNGRLRLRLFESFAFEEEEEEEEAAETQKQEACGEEDAGADVECSGEELEEYVDNAEEETGMTKFGRPSRCKESGNRDIFGDVYFELPPLSLCL